MVHHKLTIILGVDESGIGGGGRELRTNSYEISPKSHLARKAAKKC